MNVRFVLCGLFLGVCLPGMAMAQELRKADFTKPILMLTSINKMLGIDYGRDDEMVPVDAFQEKPVESAKLVSLVNDLLSK